MCLRILLGNHQRVCITKLLKSLYPSGQKKSCGFEKSGGHEKSCGKGVSGTEMQTNANRAKK